MKSLKSRIFRGCFISFLLWANFFWVIAASAEEPKLEGHGLHATVTLPMSDGKAAEVELSWVPVGNEVEVRAMGPELVEDVEAIRRATGAPPVALITGPEISENSGETRDPAVRAVADAFTQRGAPLEQFAFPPLPPNASRLSTINHSLRTIFADPSLRPRTGEMYIGIAKGVLTGATFTYIYFFKMAGLTPELATGLVTLQTVLALGQSVRERTIDRLFKTNFTENGKVVPAHTRIFRRLAYSVFLNEIFRTLTGPIHGIPPFFSVEGQMNLFTYVALADGGSAMLANAKAKAFEKNPTVYSRFSFLAYLITAPLFFREANHVADQVIFNIGFYEFTDTSLITMGAALGLTAVVKTMPGKIAWMLTTLPSRVKNSAMTLVGNTMFSTVCEMFL